MLTPSLDQMDTETLRGFALAAWRRAEDQERRAAAEERRATAEAQRAAALADDVHKLTERNAELALKTTALEAEVAVLLKRITEITRELAAATSRDAQLELELELRRLRTRLSDANQEIFGSKDEGRDRTDGKHRGKKKEPKKQTGHGPTKQPKLPIVEVVHLLDEADCCCPKCAGDLRVMAEQFEESELISAVRVSFVLELHKLQKYRCGRCGHIEAALGPQRLIPGGRYDLSFAVQVAVAKYLEHMPLERQVKHMGRHGLEVTSQTLWDQLFALYLVLLPTFVALEARVLASPVAFADETRWRVMGEGGRRRSARWWLWTLTSTAGVLMDIQPSRGAAAARKVLQDFAGVLMADGYTVYASLEKALDRQGGAQIDLKTGEPEVLPNYTLVGCWMHARRPFIKAEKSVPEVGHALDLIAELYDIEARAREMAGDDEAALLRHRRRLREARSTRVIEELELWRDAQRPLPGTKYADGVTFLKNQWVPLTRFLSDPRIPLDNGEAERKIRGPVLGRKNFAGSLNERGARVAGLFYSLLMSAEQEGVDAHAYLMAAARVALEDREALLLPSDYAAQLRQSDAE